jgi:L-alanine-DL-glutamate epimerase-like enolase superfamily enzyme
MVVLRLRAEDGVTGLGEAVPLAQRGESSLAEVRGELEGPCAAALEGADLSPLRDVPAPGARTAIAALVAACRDRGTSSPALAAVDVALHDLAGRLRDEPVWRLLGALEAKPVRCNGTLAAAPPAAVAERAAGLVAAGFRTLKLKVGLPDDLAAVAAVRARIGPDPRIRVDANGIWSPDEALDRLAGMEPHGIELVEQPASDLEGLARVRAATPIPVAADESVTGPADAARAVELGACDLATAKLAKVGGIAAALEVAAAIPTYLSSALDGPIGIAAAAHATQALPRSGPAADLAHGLATSPLFAAIPAANVPTLDGDLLIPPAGPGLGIELDESALERLRI